MRQRVRHVDRVESADEGHGGGDGAGLCGRGGIDEKKMMFCFLPPLCYPLPPHQSSPAPTASPRTPSPARATPEARGTAHKTLSSQTGGVNEATPRPPPAGSAPAP